MGVEPTNNGFANRPAKEDIDLQNKHLQTSGQTSLARILPKLDPDLVVVIERWPVLPEHIRRAIKELITSE